MEQQDRPHETERKRVVVEEDDDYVLLGPASVLTRNGRSNVTENNNGKGRS